MTSNNNVMELYDRQNRTYGTEATKTLTTSNVVVFGLEGGVSTELCKNLTKRFYLLYFQSKKDLRCQIQHLQFQIAYSRL